jgi:hypothetical protein
MDRNAKRHEHQREEEFAEHMRDHGRDGTAWAADARWSECAAGRRCPRVSANGGLRCLDLRRSPMVSPSVRRPFEMIQDQLGDAIRL